MDGAFVAVGQSRSISKHIMQQHTVHERRRTGGVGVRAHARGSLLTGETSAPACFPRRYICELKRRRESNMLGIRGVRRGIYAYDGKCDGTYLHIRDGARVPIGEVAIERGRIRKHALQQHTRCMSAGARAEWACEHMPCGSLLTGETSAPACFPRRYICELKRRRESNMLGIRGVRRGIIYI